MTQPTVREDLYDPRHGGQAIRIARLRLDQRPVEPARTNCFAINRIESGSGTFWADPAHFAFGPDALLFFVPYQHVRFVPAAPVHGQVVHFHANFLCVETFHAEVGCSGAWFNDPFGVPVVALDGPARSDVRDLLERIRKEHDERDLAYRKVMLAHLKVLLVLATRLKASRAGGGRAASGPGRLARADRAALSPAARAGGLCRAAARHAQDAGPDRARAAGDHDARMLGVPALGDAQPGFPYLSGAGRLVVKDAVMMGAALVTMADSANADLHKRAAAPAAAYGGERLLTASVR